MEFPYELQAKRGEPMPNGLDWLDQQMYIALRYLYASVRHGFISMETGKAEKAKLSGQYIRTRGNDEFGRKWVKHTSEMYKAIELAVNTYSRNKTIENADRVIDAVYGFVRTGEDLSWAE